MLIGYARVSTEGQSLEPQLDALARAGIEPGRVYVDQASGARADRPGLAEAVKALRAGDVLVVVKLDRLARSLRELIELGRRIEATGAELRSLGDAIDTSTPAGRLLFHMLGAIAEFERELIRERTQAGLRAARARGRRGGRKPVLAGQRLEAARVLWRKPTFSADEIAAQFKVSRRTLFRLLGPREVPAADE